jgi:eukaryotic-like serine/threonine-protein kinase
MAIAPGTRLGPYVVNSLIGVGGMGEVYQATDTNLSRSVAIKVLPDSMAADADRVARFDREAKTLAALSHPNIALIYGVERSDRQLALIMELVDGETLADRISSGPIPVDEALAIAKQIAGALEAAHEQGIVHRDLKPANIKLRPDGQPKVLDFGLAKAMDSVADGATMAITSPALVTGAGLILGTAAYMAPEHAKGRSVDKRADIWAFGVILYEMVTGKPLFAGETVVETLAAVVTKAPDLSLAPAAVRPLLQATLEPDPRRRLRDIGDAFRFLELAPPQPVSRARQSRALMTGLGAAAVLASLLAAFIWIQRPSPPNSEPLRLQINFPPGASPDAGMALSPDGRRLAFFVVDPKGQRSVWVRELDSFEARPLPGTENVFTVPLFWSYDSRSLGFVSERGVQRVNVVGGGDPAVISSLGEIGADWSADGTIIFGTNPAARAGGGGGLFRVAAGGGEAVPVTVVDTARGEYAHHHPRFLPDGRRFLYLRTMRPQDRSGIYVGSLDTTPENQSTDRLLATEYGPVFFVPSPGRTSGLLFFQRDNMLLAQPFDPERVALTGEPIQVASPVGVFIDRALFYVSRGGTILYTTSATALTRQLTWVDRGGKVLNTVGSTATLNEAALSPDGTQAAVAIPDLLSSSARIDLWIWNLVRGTQTLFASGDAQFGPVWSADGTRLVFTNGNALYERPRTALEDARLISRATPGDQIRSTSWSADGRFILVNRENPQAGRDIWAVSRADGTAAPLIVTPAVERDAQFSPDGKWIAYTMIDSSGQNVYVTGVDASSQTLRAGGGPWRVSAGGGRDARWRADSRELYYAGPESMMSVPVFTDAGFAVGAPTALPAFSTTAGVLGGRLGFVDVSADGKRFLDARSVDVPTTRAPANVLLNWKPIAPR